MPAYDYKKAYKDLYLPKTRPAVIDVPEMRFIMVDGQGDPNTSEAYKAAMEILYGLSYTIKMSKMSGSQPSGYFDYVVPPLEGLWRTIDGNTFDFIDKSRFCWTSMIRQPEFVTKEVFENAVRILAGKKTELDCSPARFEILKEGLCAQVMHIGPYDDEPATISALEQFISDSGYITDIADKRRHHEIYLGDPRKTAPEKLKTVIRLPIRVM